LGHSGSRPVQQEQGAVEESVAVRQTSNSRRRMCRPPPGEDGAERRDQEAGAVLRAEAAVARTGKGMNVPMSGAAGGAGQVAELTLRGT